jgi:hypothetical protein
VFRESVKTLDAVWRAILVSGCVSFMATEGAE